MSRASRVFTRPRSGRRAKTRRRSGGGGMVGNMVFILLPRFLGEKVPQADEGVVHRTWHVPSPGHSRRGHRELAIRLLLDEHLRGAVVDEVLDDGADFVRRDISDLL